MYKTLKIDKDVFTLVIKDYCCGVKGWFEVCIYDGDISKWYQRIFRKSFGYFTTFDNPIEVAKQSIERIKKCEEKLNAIYQKLESTDIE